MQSASQKREERQTEKTAGTSEKKGGVAGRIPGAAAFSFEHVLRLFSLLHHLQERTTGLPDRGWLYRLACSTTQSRQIAGGPGRQPGKAVGGPGEGLLERGYPRDDSIGLEFRPGQGLRIDRHGTGQTQTGLSR
jgi:hypothetical protein